MIAPWKLKRGMFATRGRPRRCCRLEVSYLTRDGYNKKQDEGKETRRDYGTMKDSAEYYRRIENEESENKKRSSEP
jgi:hypothetical protein